MYFYGYYKSSNKIIDLKHIDFETMYKPILLLSLIDFPINKGE